MISSKLLPTLLVLSLVIFVAQQNVASQTPRPSYCKQTSDCGSTKTNQACINGICGCIMGYSWDNDIFACTVRPCKQAADCSHLWKNSVCSNSKSGHCVCDKKFHLDVPTQTCQPGAAPSSAQAAAPLMGLVLFAAAFISSGCIRLM